MLRRLGGQLLAVRDGGRKGPELPLRAQPREQPPGEGKAAQHLSRHSMACFLEELQPEALMLGAEARLKAEAGLALLRSKPPLEAVLLCLELLSEGECSEVY